jgi:hypothetical protein
MADPLFHLSAAILLKSALNQRPLGLFALGSVLPDLASRLPGLALERLPSADSPLPTWLANGWPVFHQPIGAAVLCVAVVSAFVAPRPAFIALYAGVAFHFLVDLLQFHHGEGYALLAPLQFSAFELGWIGSEATLPWSVPLTAVAFAAWGFRIHADRSRVTPPPPSTDDGHGDGPTP